MTFRDRADIPPAEEIRFSFDSETIRARRGETIGAALAASGVLALRRTRNGAPRGLHCGMGACFDCLVTVDGRAGARACLEKAHDGQRVESRMPGAAPPDDAATGGAASVPATGIARHDVDVLVAGAGPAGATAAAILAEAGARVIVCDERAEGGGQYFKPKLVGDGQATDGQFAEGQALAERLARSGATLWSSTTVWFASIREGVGVVRQGEAAVVVPRVILLATGASERPYPVPGWTLPGVLTTGGLQALVRSQRVAPGQRIVIGGSGPLNLQLACELLRLGVRPVAVVDSGPGVSPAALPGLAGMLAADPRSALAGLGALVTLRRTGVPVIWGGRISEVRGEGRVSSVTVRRSGRDSVIACDAVALNAGFQPQAELARQLGCALRYVPDHAGAVAVAIGDDGATSVPEVFAIGDGAAIAGARVAMAMARLSAAAIGARLGLAVDAGNAAAALRRARRFQTSLWSVFVQPAFDAAALPDETILCRCEEVTAGAVRAACRSASPTLATVKRLTRAGMGRCQGRFCAGPLTKLVEAEGGPVPDVSAFFAPRPPARPVPLGALAVEKPEWGGHRQSAPPAVSPRVAMPRAPFGRIEADVAVIGAGVVGSCVALELAKGGRSVVVLDRHEPNVQASGANAGSLHVQLLSFDFGAKAQAGGRPAAEVLRIAPASIALWKELETAAGEGFEIATPGGLMVGESAADMEFLRRKTELERAYGIDSTLIGANELAELEPHLARRFAGAALCRDEGKINPLVATLAVVRLAKDAGARFEAFAGVTGLTRQGARWHVETEAGTVDAGLVVNCAGGWASRVAAMAARPIPVQGAPLQMIVTEPGPVLVKHLVAHGSRHLSLKQAETGGLIIGGAWPAALDPETGASHVEMASIEGNAWVAAHVLPAAARLGIVRVWAAMNINIDGAPILGEMPGAPGFWNCVTSNGYSLAPVVARITADLILRGRSDHPHAMFGLARF
jgi:glycine/D-amino acid oxidase-like deaminating enzyme